MIKKNNLKTLVLFILALSMVSSLSTTLCSNDYLFKGHQKIGMTLVMYSVIASSLMIVFTVLNRSAISKCKRDINRIKNDISKTVVIEQA